MAKAEHKVGDRYVAEAQKPELTLVVSYNVYQRWTVVVIDRNTNCPLLELHEENSLQQAQRYAEGFVRGAFGKEISTRDWVPQPKQ